MKTRSIIASLILLASAVVLADEVVLADDAPKVIKAEEARNHVDQKCDVTFKVRRTKHGVNRKTYFLDSREDFKSPENLGIQISEEMAAELKAKKGVGEPHTHYADKTIRVTGKVFLQEDRPYIRVESVDDIREVEQK
jgi:hypothetical protein